MNKFGHKDVERLKQSTSEPCENSNGNDAGSTSSKVGKKKKNKKKTAIEFLYFQIIDSINPTPFQKSRVLE
jgi:hypothetical protein